MDRHAEKSTSALVDDYHRDGFVRLDYRASDADLAEVDQYIAKRVAEGHAGNICDANGRLRAVHGYDKRSGMLSALMARFADTARVLLDCEQVYVYQFRVNVKNGATDPRDHSGAWKPHRDFDYWRNLDGMRAPRAVIFHMLVNQHHADNGPLEVCPRSHRSELSGDDLRVAPESDWQAGFSENIKYQIDARSFARRESLAIHGDAGTLLAMHPMLWHGSSPNRTDTPRTLLSIIFNDLANAVDNPERPPFVVQPPAYGCW